MTRSVLALFLLVFAACSPGPMGSVSRTLVAASNMRHPPFSSWGPDGTAVGTEVDLVEEAARELGWRVTWVERPFAELLPAIEKGEIDVAVSTIGITPERQGRVAFSRPYDETQIVALVRNDDAAPDSLEELSEARIGADEVTTAYPAARARWPSAILVGRSADGLTWPQMLDQRRIDAFVVDASDQQRLEAQSGIPMRRIAEALSAEYFGVALRRGEDDLRAALNRVIAHSPR